MLRIATRKSPLALQQAHHVAQQLQQLYPDLEIELVPMTTQGDELLHQKLLNFGGKGLFVKELEQALIEHRADIAVHSMKDVPALFPEGLKLHTICKRDNPFDAFISKNHKSLNTLKPGSTIGTASLRRQAQLLAYRPDLKIQMLRGNIHTRLEKLERGDFDAIILACAGLERMKLQEKIQQTLTTDIMLPACGQGAIGIECRSDDIQTQALIEKLQCLDTTLCVQIERAVNRELGGHCHVPIAIFAHYQKADLIHLQARIYNAQGTHQLRWEKEFSASQAMEYAQVCAKELLHLGALELIHDEKH